MIVVPGRNSDWPDGKGRTPETVRPTARFSRPLVTVTSRLSAATVTGKPAWDEAKQVLRIPVRLEAGARYRLLLNSESDGGFTSRAGEKLSPRSWTFSVD